MSVSNREKERKSFRLVERSMKGMGEYLVRMLCDPWHVCKTSRNTFDGFSQVICSKFNAFHFTLGPDFIW
jgi:hypothetical protein